MSSYVNAQIKCPCGRLIRNYSCRPDSTSIVHGYAHCPSCGKKVEYEITRGKAHTHYAR